MSSMSEIDRRLLYIHMQCFMLPGKLRNYHYVEASMPATAEKMFIRIDDPRVTNLQRQRSTLKYLTGTQDCLMLQRLNYYAELTQRFTTPDGMLRADPHDFHKFCFSTTIFTNSTYITSLMPPPYRVENMYIHKLSENDFFVKLA